MNHQFLKERWKHEERQPMSGWDFAYLTNRMFEEQPPWSYSARAIELLKDSSSVIDLDTGGGEQFLELRPAWPHKVVATESYSPNFTLAAERLAPLGVKVVNIQLTDFATMPFQDLEFDLVLNRHAAFNPREVARILVEDGSFLTQQVHGLWGYDLLAAFDQGPAWPDATPEKYVPRLKQAGLKIISLQEWSGRLKFTDVGAIVFFLKAIPWLVPGFSVETHFRYLLGLQTRLDDQEELSFTDRKYLIEARKPALP